MIFQDVKELQEELDIMRDELKRLKDRHYSVLHWLDEIIRVIGYECVSEETIKKPAHLRKIKKGKKV